MVKRCMAFENMFCYNKQKDDKQGDFYVIDTFCFCKSLYGISIDMDK